MFLKQNVYFKLKFNRAFLIAFYGRPFVRLSVSMNFPHVYLLLKTNQANFIQTHMLLVYDLSMFPNA